MSKSATLKSTLALSLVVISLGLLPAQAQAAPEFYTALDLHKDCNNYTLITNEPELVTEKGAASLGQCHGFVSGVMDNLRFMQANYNDLPMSQFTCPPANAQIGHLIAAVMNDIQTRRPQATEPAVVTVVKALTGSFPCK